MNPALRSSAAHVFVQSLAAPELHPDDAHHLFRVLRVRDGEVVTVTDGGGGWLVTQVAGQVLHPVSDPVFEPAPAQLTIASAIPKGDRAEWLVQKLTEIGVARIVLVHCARSAVRWEGERGERHLQRARRVAREAAMQSRRVWMPDIAGPESLSAVVLQPNVVLAAPEGVAPADLAVTPATVVIGPEGGFTPDELACGAPSVRLGDTILRVETAAIVAAARFAQ